MSVTPVVIVSRKTYEVSQVGLYRYLAHLGKFARPGDHRIEVTGKAVKVCSMVFKSATGKTILTGLCPSPTSM